MKTYLLTPCWFVLCLLAVAFPVASSTVAGSSDGDFAVEQGVASYQISLAVPPGARGVQPSLALAYSSGQGNGVLGVGFRLQGVSAIARCGAQIVSDNIKGGVSYDDQDRFCLNGQRLVQIGTLDGQPEYRTQIESWQRIVSAGTCGSGPCSFTLYRGDGTTSTFGLKNGSAIHALGAASASVRVWMQDTVTDPNGNIISFHYTQTPSLTQGGGTSNQSQSGQGYLDKITYGPSGATASRSVQFLYQEGRQDTILRYLGGGSITTALLLAQIETSIQPVGASVQQVMSYTLSYDEAPTTGRSRLGSVAQCAAGGDCFNATRFTWTDGGDSLVSAPTSTPMASNASSYVGDFDGNGLTDIFVWSSGSQHMYFSNGSGFDSAIQTCVADYLSRIFLGDFNGDGSTDTFAVGSGSNNSGFLYPGGGVSPTGSTPCCANNSCPSAGVGSSDHLLDGDFNGDGLTDLLAYGPSSSKIYLSQGTSFVASSHGSSGPGLPNESLFPGDYNGDGRADILALASSGTGNIYYSVQSSSSMDDTVLGNITSVTDSLSGQFQWVSDFNNDGLTDVLVGEAPGGSSFISYGTGTGMAAGSSLSIPLSDESYVGDFNGDGLPDIFIAAGSKSTLYLGNGVGFNCVKNGSQCATMDPKVSAKASFLGDFNGDGLTDGFTADPSSGTFDWAATGGAVATENQVADLLVSIVDGYGGETKVTYKPITNPSVYEASNDKITGIANLYHPTPLSPVHIQSYPIRPVRSGQYVVAQYEQVNDADLNAQGYDYTYCYTYAHGVLNLVGRGWMGYQTITQKDPQLKAQTTTTYRQDFPLNGRVQTEETYALQGPTVTCGSSAGPKLQNVSATWSCLNSQPPQQACTDQNVNNKGYTPGDIQVFYVTPATTTTEDATFGSDVTTQYTFDDWGNLETVAGLDGLGRIVRVDDNNDQGTAMTRQTQYLDPSHVSQKSLPGSQADNWVVYAYDALARIQSTTQPTWDINGNKTSTTDTVTYSGQNTMTVTQAASTSAAFSQQRRIRYYGGQPMVHSAESVGGGTTTIDYDGMGRMAKVSNPASATGDVIVDSVTYDSLGRVIERDDSGTGARQFFYGEHGLLSHEIDPMGQKITFGWDPLHRQTSQQTYVKVGDDFELETEVTITYDVAAGSRYSNTLGRAATASLTRSLPFEAAELTYDFGYDAWGRQSMQDVVFSGQTFAFDVGYDPQGRPVSRQYPTINGSRPKAEFSFWESYGGLKSVGFSADGREESLTNWLQLSDYNALGQPGQATYGNQVVESWGYFDNGLPSAHGVVGMGASSLLNEMMGWDPGNELTTVLDCNYSTQSPCPAGSGGSPVNHGATYSYDLLRLSTVDDSESAGTYCYDNAGNLVQSDGVVFTYTGNQVVTGNTANTPSQCKSAQGDQVFSAQYDDNGNMEWREVDSNRVDLTTGVEGWLLLTEVGGKTFERFAYDYTGQRVMRTVFGDDGETVDYVVLYPAPDFEVTLTNGGSAGATVYLFSGPDKFAALTSPLPTQEVEQLAQAVGVTLDAGAPPVAEQALVLHRDQVGSTVAVTDDSGQAYAMVSYGAWGEPTITPSENDDFRPLFGGKEYTEETDLYYFGARYLDTFTGRFTSADTQVAAGPLVPDSFNDYAYALNNPVLYADPSGHFPVAKVALGVLAGATAIALGAAGLDVLAGEEIALTVDIEEDDLAMDEILDAEPKPTPDEGTPLLDDSSPDDGPAKASQTDTAKPEDKTRLGKLKKHAASLAENIVQSEVVNLSKYTAMHSRGNWSWKGFGYTSATAVLGGILSFDAGTIADSVAGTGSTDHELIKTLVKGPIQGAASADMGRALNTAFTSSSSQHSWMVTTARGAGTGLVLSPMVFGLKMAASSP